MTGILPYWISQLVFLGEAKAFISPIREILFPELCISAAVHLSMYILCLDHKDSIARNDDMVNLCCVFPVAKQKIIEYLVFFTFQIGQIGRHLSFSALSDMLCPAAVIGREY